MARHRRRQRRLPPGSGRIIALLAITVVGVPALAAGALGMPPTQALLIGAVCVALVAPWGRPPQTSEVGFPAAPKPQTNRGIRREAFQLSWSVASNDDSVGAQLISHIQRIAARRLAGRGLNLSDPADRDQILARIGEDAYQVLVTPAGIDIPRRDFRDALTAVENLGPVAPNPLVDDQPGKEYS